MAKQLVVDWYNDSNYGKAGCDVTARTLRSSCERGRDYASQMTGRSIAGKLTAVLNNQSGDYSSFNGASPLTGKILPGRKIQLRETPPFGYFATFDGGQANINCGSDASIDDIFNGGGTIEAWVYVRSDGGNGEGRIYDKSKWKLVTVSEAGGFCELAFQHNFAAANGAWRSTTLIQLNTWLHISVTYDNSAAANDPIIRFNGVVVGINETSAPLGLRIDDSGDSLYVGNTSAGEEGFDGYIDEARVWGDIRTATEITDNYLKELIGTETDLELYYQFHEGGGDTAHDRTANANDGSASSLWGYLTFTDWYPYYPGSYIAAGSGAQIDDLFAGGGTVEAYIYPSASIAAAPWTVAHKSKWKLYLSDLAGGSVKVNFWRDFDGAADGHWRTNAVQAPLYSWTHIAVTYDDTNVANNPIIYINGVAVAITEVTTPVGNAVSDAADNMQWGAYAEYYSGRMTDCRLWGDIRSAAEVLANYALRLTGGEADLELYYKCDDGSGATVTDTGPNGYNGTWSTTPASSGWGSANVVGSTFGWDNSTYWCGHLKSLIPRTPLDGMPIAVLEAVGPLAQIASAVVNVAQQLAVSTGSVEGSLLTALSWDANLRTIDEGVVSIERVLPPSADGLALMREIEDTEAGFLAEDPGDRIVFEARDHRSKPPHTVSQSTFSDDVLDILHYQDIEQDDPLLYIYNEIQVYAESLTVSALADLWTCPFTGADFAIPAGATVEMWAEYPNPSSANNAVGVAAWTTPAATTDYIAGSTPGGVDKTAQVVITSTKYATKMHLAVTNNDAATVYITLLKARGTPVTRDNPVLVKASDATSQGKYGLRTYVSDANYIQSRALAQAWCDDMLALYKAPRPVLTLTYLASVDSDHTEQALDRDISDRITVVAQDSTLLGINDDFFIEYIAHSIDMAALRHITTYKLTPA